MLITALLLAGTGTAAAYWTAQADVERSATAATVGMEQTLLPTAQTTPLKTTFDVEERAAAGAVSVENTGSRAADSTVTVRYADTSDASLASAITVRAGEVPGADSCTPAATLDDAKTATLSPGATLQLTGRLDAGETTVVCVGTEVTLGGAIARAGKAITLGVTSELTYADGDDWTLQEQTPGIVQAVSAEPFGGRGAMRCHRDHILARADLDLTHSYDRSGQYRARLMLEGGRGELVELPVDIRGLISPSLYVKDRAVGEFVDAQGTGHTWVILEKKTASGWTVVDHGKVHIFRSDSILGEFQVNCA